MARKDYKHLILDTARHNEKWETFKRVKDSDMDADKAPMRNIKGKQQSDRLSPLYRFIRKQVGRRWDDVYSELCSQADPRSVKGFHLRSHIEDIVILNKHVVKTEDGYRRLPSSYPSFIWSNDPFTFSKRDLYVDDEGFLRKPKPHELRNKNAKQERSLPRRSPSSISSFSAYIYFSDSWWYVEWLEPELEYKENSVFPTLTREFRLKLSRFNKVITLTKTGYKLEELTPDLFKQYISSYYSSYQGVPTIIFPLFKRQISKKEIKENNLEE